MALALPSSFNVIPVHDKVPQVPWREFVKREQTPDEKAKMLELCASGNGIGVVCGPVSKVFVLDDDGSVELKKYQLPRTATVRTPRGGRHYYFSWVPELDGKKTTDTNIFKEVVIPPATKVSGADVRGLGGYVVHYGWEVPPTVAPIARPPQWLIDRLSNREGQKITKVLGTLEGMQPGNRNVSFTSLAGSLRARGYKPEEIFGLLKPRAKEMNFSEDELATICKSIGRYEPKVQLDEQGISVDEFLIDAVPVEWLCEPLIARGAIGVMAGLPETGKTFALLDLAIECARGGGLWLGKFPVKGARVLLIDQERDKRETQRRLTAIISGKQFSASSLKGNLFVRCGTTTRIDLTHSSAAFTKEIADIRPDLIIVDSFRTFHTKSLKDEQGMQEVMEKIKAIRTEFGCSFMFVHHEVKSVYQGRKEGNAVSYLDGEGSVAIAAAAEHYFNIVQHDAASSMVYHTKNTMGTKGAPFIIRVRDLKPDKSEIAVEAL